MVESPSLLLAFAAGVVSFVSPCCLPLVPGYLATVCGSQRPDDPSSTPGRSRVLGRSVMFVATFATIFVLLGLGATAIGSLLLGIYSAGLALPFLFSATAFDTATRTFAFFKRRHAAIQVVSGVVLVAMGYLVLTGELFRLNIEVQQFLARFGLNLFQSV